MTTANLSNNVAENLEKLAHIRLKNPSTTHVYIRRCDKDDLVVDIPIEQAEFTIRNRPYWKLEASNKQMDDAVEKLFLEPEPVIHPEPIEPTVPEGTLPPYDITIPPKPSEKPKRKYTRRKANASPA